MKKKPVLPTLPLPILLPIFLLLLITPLASAWGSLGHRTVAYLAQKHLSADGAAWVGELLGDEDISDAALWADQIRRTRGWTFTAGWHYIDAQDDPPRSCGVNFRRDCIPKEGCVVSAITNMTSQAINAKLSPQSRYEALKFLLHFIGDIHQPLHTEAEDRGGNEIAVLFNKKHTNLHSIWDTEILEKHAGGPKDDEKADAASWADALDGALTAMEEGGGVAVRDECTNVRDAAGCALEWAGEANAYICSYVLKDDVEGVEGRNLAEDYYEGAVPIVDYLVGKAGLRLAGWINALAALQARIVIQGEEELHVGL